MGRVLTFVIKAIYPIDTGAFVIAPEDEEVFGIFDLVSKKQADRLETLLPSINIIAKEEVVCFWWEPAVFEESQEVVILAVDVACAAAGERSSMLDVR